MKYSILTTVLCLAFLLMASVVSADIPQLINYQGYLTDDQGDPVVDGSYLAKFKIYGSESGTDSLWSSGFQVINTNGGVFTYTIGFAETLPDDIFSTDPTRYLGITIGADSEIYPRTKLIAVPYAYHALLSDTAAVSYSIECNGCITSLELGVGAVENSELAPDAVTSDKIQDETIQFSDIGPNSAGDGQVMKRSGGVWTAADDETGSAGGWVDDGNVVRLETVDDSVGIGTTTPTEKLDVNGNLNVSGKTTIGSGNTNSTTHGLVAGYHNYAGAEDAAVLGGKYNVASGTYSIVAGGRMNSASGLASAILGGQDNEASGDGSSVVGGFDNHARNSYSFIGGGGQNWNDGYFAVISGGLSNHAFGLYSFVGGGFFNKARGDYSVVAGGGGLNPADSNAALGNYSTVSGGGSNHATADYSSVAGGANNDASGLYSFTGGGYYSKARGDYSVVAGGGGLNPADSNLALGNYSAVGGGFQNHALGDGSAVFAGGINTASNLCSVVAGGGYNTASGIWAFVAGGMLNIASGEMSYAAGYTCTASGHKSFALGSYATASHSGSFVWNDYNGISASSERDNQFKVSANGGVKFEINNSRYIDFYDAGGNLIYVDGGAKLTSGGVWTDACDRNLKENFAELNRQELLEKIASLPITRWNYKVEPSSITHISPVAQDFHATFGVGDEEGIASLDGAGIALAAIQELHKKNTELETEVAELRALVEKLLEEQ